jgi:RNA polymerase sigma-70 factor, ECF subfamily
LTQPLPPGGRPDQPSSDEQLLAQFQCGSQTAFQTLYRRHYPRARSLALSLTHDKDDACEVVQEAFIRVLRNWFAFEGQTTFCSWLYRIVYNLSVDRLRRPYQKRVSIEDLEALLGDLTPPSMSAVTPSDPYEACSAMELRRQIADAIQSLPRHHRDVIVTRELYGMTYSEMAEALLCSKGTIMSRLFHARRHLQRLLRALPEESAAARTSRPMFRLPPSLRQPLAEKD